MCKKIRWFRQVSALLLGVSILMTGLSGTAPEVQAAESFRISTAFGSNMVLQQKQDIHVFGFGAAGKTVTVTLQRDGGSPITASGEIVASGKWDITLPAQNASFDEYTLTATDGNITKKLTNILFGEVWVTGGQSNMKLTVAESVEVDTWKRKKRNSNIRLYVQNNYTTIYEPSKEPSGVWYSASDWTFVEQYSAIAYYFAESLYREIQVPIGLIDSSVGGTPIWAWISQETMDGSPEMKKWLQDNDMYHTKDTWAVVDGRGTYAKYRGGLYNSRVAPLEGLRAAGILWYQGEDQVPDPAPLTYGIPLLVEDWSRVFGDGESLLPLISIQLAPYSYYEKGSLPVTNEVMNEAVMEVDKISGKALSIPIYDVSLYSKPDNHPIHPATKQPVGERCAQAAAGMVYGLLDVYSGPVPTSAVASGNTITVTFDNVGAGLDTTDNLGLMGFKISKESGASQTAVAKIASKNTIVIEQEDAALFTGVQYAFAAMNNTSNLCNKEGFMALPFRIDVKQETKTTKAPGSITTATKGENGNVATAVTENSEVTTDTSTNTSVTDITLDSTNVNTEQTTITDSNTGDSDTTDTTTTMGSDPVDGKPIGSLPAWIWGVIGGAVLLIGGGLGLYFWRKQGKAS